MIGVLVALVALCGFCVLRRCCNSKKGGELDEDEDEYEEDGENDEFEKAGRKPSEYENSEDNINEDEEGPWDYNNPMRKGGKKGGRDDNDDRY